MDYLPRISFLTSKTAPIVHPSRPGCGLVSTIVIWNAPNGLTSAPSPKKERQLRPVEPFEDWPDAMRKANDLGRVLGLRLRGAL
jgi:hypothetical protein